MKKISLLCCLLLLGIFAGCSALKDELQANRPLKEIAPENFVERRPDYEGSFMILHESPEGYVLLSLEEDGFSVYINFYDGDFQKQGSYCLPHCSEEFISSAGDSFSYALNPAVLSESTVAFLSEDRQIFCLNRSGELLWETGVPPECYEVLRLLSDGTGGAFLFPAMHEAEETGEEGIFETLLPFHAIDAEGQIQQRLLELPDNTYDVWYVLCSPQGRAYLSANEKDKPNVTRYPTLFPLGQDLQVGKGYPSEKLWYFSPIWKKDGTLLLFGESFEIMSVADYLCVLDADCNLQRKVSFSGTYIVKIIPLADGRTVVCTNGDGSGQCGVGPMELLIYDAEWKKLHTFLPRDDVRNMISLADGGLMMSYVYYDFSAKQVYPGFDAAILTAVERYDADMTLLWRKHYQWKDKEPVLALLPDGSLLVE